MKFMINLIEKCVTNVNQRVVTTKNVKDKDIILAYYAAREWMKLVYPEFYNKKDDVFLEKYVES